MKVSSDITTDSRLKVLESGMPQILKLLQNQTTQPPSPPPPTVNTDQTTFPPLTTDSVSPTPSNERAGEYYYVK